MESEIRKASSTESGFEFRFSVNHYAGGANRRTETASIADRRRGHPRAKVFVPPSSVVSHQQNTRKCFDRGPQRRGLAAAKALSRLAKIATAKWKRRSLSECWKRKICPFRAIRCQSRRVICMPCTHGPRTRDELRITFLTMDWKTLCPTIAWCDAGKTAARKPRTFRYFRVTCS